MPRLQNRAFGRPARIILSDLTLRESLETAALHPDYFCCVCCRILFRNECCRLKVGANQALADQMVWPCEYYGRQPHVLDGRLVTCKAHEKLDRSTVEYVEFVTRHWGNPRLQARVIHPQPIELTGLSWNDMLVLCKVATFSKFVFPARSGPHARIAMPQLDGSVSIYQSDRSVFGPHHGATAFAYDPTLEAADRERIRQAFEWLRNHNPLYQEFAGQHELPQEIAYITPTPEHSTAAERRRQGFSTQVLVQPDPGPRANEVNLTDLNIALDKTTGNAVKFTYMGLVASLFPEIYIFGHSAFQLRHQKHSLQQGLMVTPRQELPQVVPPALNGDDPVHQAQELAEDVAQLLGDPAVANPNPEAVDAEEEEEDHEGDRPEQAGEEAVGEQAQQEADAAGEVEPEGDQPEEDQAEGVQQQQATRARFTIKAYAKMRLLHFDRTWAQNARFLTFFFDWSNKDNVYGYRLRSTTSTRGGAGEATRVSDVLQGGRLQRGGSIAFPPSIRTGAAYRQQLRRSALCMFRDFKTPQIFGTWTANVQGPGFDCCRVDANGEPSAVWDDIPKFVCAYSREWDRVWTYIRRSWAEMLLGGLVAWFWVTEFQDRGVPHVHFVLWTKWTMEQLLEANRSGDRRRVIISTSSAPLQDLPNRQLQQLRGRPVPLDLDLVAKVATLQMHHCRDDYCLKSDSGQARTRCRFNFPRPACPTTRLDENGRFEYLRTEVDCHVNPYNPDLLRFAGSTIDLQLNQGAQAMNYITKYITKPVKVVEAELAQPEQAVVMNVEAEQGPAGGPRRPAIKFRYNHLSLPEIAMAMLGFNLCGSSSKVEHLPTHAPQNRRRVLKAARVLRAIQSEDPESTDIFASDKWERYLERPLDAVLDTVTYPRFFQEYHEIFTDPGEDQTVYLDQRQVPRPRKYVRYLHERRSHTYTRSIPMSAVEETCMFLLMLEMPTRVDTDTWLEHYNVESYFELAWARLGPQRMAQIRPVLPGVNQAEAAHEPELPVLNAEQDNVLTRILTHPGRYMVSGRAGTGKSVLLLALARALREQGRFFPIVLAPTGVAALNIHGQTLHRFFGTRSFSDAAFLPDPYTVQWNLHVVTTTGREPFLIIDEYSMISAGALNNASETLYTCNLDEGSAFEPFGNIPVVMFGDLGQIGPFTNTAGALDDLQDDEQWIWNGADYYSFEQIQLVTPCRLRPEEQRFLEFLRVIRDGPQTATDLQRVQDVLKERDRTHPASGPLPSLVSCTILMSKRRVAKEYNDSALRAGPFADEPLIEIVAVDGTQMWTAQEQALALPPTDENDQRLVTMEADTGLETVLRLKRGCRVMLTSNVDLSRGLANGTMAVFRTLRMEEGKHVVDLDLLDGDQRRVSLAREYREVAAGGRGRLQFPIKLAFAVTIHRAQGLTLDKVIFDMDGLFAHGQAYVAMSRVRSLDDLFLLNVPRAVLNSLHALSTMPHLFPTPEMRPHLRVNVAPHLVHQPI